MPRNTSHSYDVVIIGGGVIGSAIAYFLMARADFDGSVAVVEQDQTYAEATSARSVGGIRQQFSGLENIRLSMFAAEFIRSAGRHLSVDGDAPALGFVEAGYLFLASPDKVETLRDNHQRQLENQARVSLLEPEALAARFPWLNTDGIGCGSLGVANEGWLDPYALLMAFRNKARSLGVDYLAGRVTGVKIRDGRTAGVILESGEQIGCQTCVNGAGARAAEIAAMAGLELPVRPRKRQVFVFDCRSGLADCPLVIDPSGMYFRPEGARFICGISPPESDDPDTLDHEVDYGLFDEVLWPLLAARVTAFESIKLANAWACTYAYNTLDQNAIVGPHPDLPNFYFANGFSGHGLQQSPGVGRGVAELIACGRYQTLDLSCLSYERILHQRPYRELNVV